VAHGRNLIENESSVVIVGPARVEQVDQHLPVISHHLHVHVMGALDPDNGFGEQLPHHTGEPKLREFPWPGYRTSRSSVGHIAAEVCTSGLHVAAEATPVGSIADRIERYSAFFISISLQKSLHFGAIEPGGAGLALGVHSCLQARFSGQWLRPSGRNPAW